jgi:hypothetical protein
MCGANEICKGPNPDRIMEGNSYFGMGGPPMRGLHVLYQPYDSYCVAGTPDISFAK